MNDNLTKPLWQLTAGEFLEIMTDGSVTSTGKKDGRTIRGINNLAAELGVSTPTVHKWKKSGVIPFSQVGRIVHFDIEQVQKAIKLRKEGRND